MAQHQNLFRTLTFLTYLTGEKTYQEAAVEEINYHYQFLKESCGLLHWGGHDAINLETLEPIGHTHELKNVLPFYDLMFAINKKVTGEFIEAFWNAHVFDWDNLEISRHGEYGKKIGQLWEHDFNNPEPFRPTIGLSFLNTGNDLIFSAARLFQFTGNKEALIWSKRLAGMYKKARHPETGLGSYQFTQAKKRMETTDDRNTLSYFGDRAQRQFGPEFGEQALEGYMLLSRQAACIYFLNVAMELKLYEEIGEGAGEFMEWSREALLMFKKHAYIEKANMFRPMIANGADLTDYVLPRDGYYGKKGKIIKGYPADSKFMLSYARAYRLTGEPEFWEMVRNISCYYGLGDPGLLPGKEANLNLKNTVADPVFILALLELYKCNQNAEYLDLARIIGDNLVKTSFKDGFFINKNNDYVCFNQFEPVALLALHAAIEGEDLNR